MWSRESAIQAVQQAAGELGMVSAQALKSGFPVQPVSVFLSDGETADGLGVLPIPLGARVAERVAILSAAVMQTQAVAFAIVYDGYIHSRRPDQEIAEKVDALIHVWFTKWGDKGGLVTPYFKVGGGVEFKDLSELGIGGDLTGMLSAYDVVFPRNQATMN